MNEPRNRPAWAAMAGIAVVAAAAGFGVAQLSGKPDAPVVAEQPEAQSAPEKKADGQSVKVPESYLAAANIVVEHIQAGSVNTEILAPATVMAPPGSEAVIVARTTGNLSKIEKRLGDTVRAGEVLATVESMQAATMVTDIRVATTRAEAARRLYEREKSLSEQGVTARQEMESAKATLDVANAEVARATSIARSARLTSDGQAIAVISPIAGRITAQRTILGASVTPDAELFRVANTRYTQIEASVTAVDSRRITAGDVATVITRSGAPLEATVRSVTPTVTGDARSATVVLLPKGDVEDLIVGEGVQVRLHIKGQTTGGFTVPEDAIQRIDGRDAIFVRDGDRFKMVPVLVGARSNGVAQIVSGVTGSERVATRNAFLLKAELGKNAEDEK